MAALLFPPDLYLEDFTAGRLFTTASRCIDAEAIVRFASEFDPQPFHLDRAAAEASAFGGLVAGGFHSAALCLRLALDTGAFRACAVAGVGVDKLRWHSPMREGDVVTVTFEVLSQRRSRSAPDRGIVTFGYRMLAGDGRLVLSMELTKVLRARTPAPEQVIPSGS